jgi:hypothetical protein
MSAGEPTLESIQAASVLAFHRWRASHPEMNLPEGASSVFLAGFAAGAVHGVKLLHEEQLRG